MARYDLTDFEWRVIKPLLPNKPRGVPRVEDRRVPVGDDWRADPTAMAAAVDDNTGLLVASAPQYPQGVVDPVEQIWIG